MSRRNIYILTVFITVYHYICSFINHSSRTVLCDIANCFYYLKMSTFILVAQSYVILQIVFIILKMSTFIDNHMYVHKYISNIFKT